MFKAPTVTLSNGNATATTTNNSFQTVLSTQPLVQKTYWEVNVDQQGGGNVLVGVAFQSAVLAGVVPSTVAGGIYNSNGLAAAPLNVAYTTGDRIGVAYDPATGNLWFRKNGTWLGNDPTGAAAINISARAPGRTYYPCGAYSGTASTAQILTLVSAAFGASAPVGYFPIVPAVKPKFSWNPSKNGANLALSNSNTTVTKSSTGRSSTVIGLESTSGKEVFAIKVTADGPGTTVKEVGINKDGLNLTVPIGGPGSSGVGYNSDGTVKENVSTVQTYATWGLNDTVMVGYVASTGTLWFGLNGTWNGDPGAGTGAAYTGYADGSTEHYAFIMAGCTDAGDALSLVPWPYVVPSGFIAPPIAP
jgi:hypothetical protein